MRPATLATLCAALTGVAPASPDTAQAIRPPVSSLRAQYRIDRQRSSLVVETHTSGMTSLFGHDHRLGVGEVAGTISFFQGAPESAAVTLSVRADSLTVLDVELDERERRDIERTVRKVLGSERYSHITFRGDGAKVEMVADGVYDVELAGELDLHGVRKDLKVPAQVFLDGEQVRIRGSCRLLQSAFRIVPVWFRKGDVGISDEVTIVFDLIARRIDAVQAAPGSAVR